MGNRKTPEIRFEGFEGEWEERKLGEVVDVRSGRDYKHLNEGNIPVYGTGGYMLSVDKALSYDEDAIGIGRKGTINKPSLLKSPFWTVDTLFYSIPKNGYDLNFANSIYQRINWKMYDESTGVPSLSKTVINNVDVVAPQKEEQKKIGAFFKHTDNTIALQKQKIDSLKLTKKGFLQKMFPKEGAKVPEIRFPGFTDDWEQRKLGEMTESFDGKRVPIDSGLRVSGQYPYYGATGIIDYVDDYIFDGEYVLLAEDGANIIMRNYPVAYLTQGKFWLNNHAHIMRMIDGNNYFLVQMLEKIDYMKYNTGTAQPKLNGKIVKNIEFNLPHIEEQQKIGVFFKHLDDTIALHQRELELLQETKKGFLQKMFV